MGFMDFLFGESPEYYQLPWQTYGPQAYQTYGQQQTAAFYDWANTYNQQAASMYGQAQTSANDMLSRARSTYDLSLGHFNTAMDQLRSGLEAELAQWDDAYNLLGEQRDAGYAAVDHEYEQQHGDIQSQAVSARGNNAVRRARQGLTGTTVASQSERAIDTKETDALGDLSDWKATQRRSIEGDYAGGVSDIQRFRQDAHRAATNMQMQLQQGLVGAEQAYNQSYGQIQSQLQAQNMNIAQMFPSIIDPMPQFNFELAQAMGTTNWPGLSAMNDPGGPGLLSDIFGPAFAGMFGAGLGAGATNAFFPGTF